MTARRAASLIVALPLQLALAIFLMSIAVGAQQSEKVYRVGYVAPSAGPSPVTAAFRRSMEDHGFAEGKNLILEYRWMAGRPDQSQLAVSELVRGGVDVLVVWGDVAAGAARKASSNLPIVFANVSAPVRSGFVTTLARPGGNMTGLTHIAPEITAKRMELLHEAAPKARRIALLLNPSNATSQADQREAEAAAKSLGLQLQRYEVKTPDMLAQAFGRMEQDGAEALLVAADPMYWSQRERIARDAIERRLPSMYFFREFVEMGGLMSYAPNLPEIARQAAGYVARILRGEAPGTLPVQQPTKFELVINLTTAKALGLTIPPSILVRADQVIE